MLTYSTLFWTPCATLCIDLILEDMGKIAYIMDIVELARSIAKFIYNHASMLSLMRKFTNNRELVCPTITRFVTSFISLKSLLTYMWEVKRIFLLDEWYTLSFSIKLEGEYICKLVSYQESFGAGVEKVCASNKPLVMVLRLVDGDTTTMSSTCMRPWIGPKNPSLPIMRTRGMRDMRNDYRYGG
jgi:hypothetical protein